MMEDDLKRMKITVVIKAMLRLIEEDRKGKVCWAHIVEQGGAAGSEIKDFLAIDEALSNEKPCNFMISMYHDGTAFVGWNTYVGRE